MRSFVQIGVSARRLLVAACLGGLLVMPVQVVRAQEGGGQGGGGWADEVKRSLDQPGGRQDKPPGDAAGPSGGKPPKGEGGKPAPDAGKPQR